MRWTLYPQGRLLTQFVIMNAAGRPVYQAGRRLLRPNVITLKEARTNTYLLDLLEEGRVCVLREGGEVLAEIYPKQAAYPLTFEISNLQWEARKLSTSPAADFCFGIYNEEKLVLAYVFKDEQQHFQLNIQAKQADTLMLTAVALALILMGKKKQRIHRLQYVTN